MTVYHIDDSIKEQYQRAGFNGKVGFGIKPAVLVVDLQRGFTESSSPLGSDVTDTVMNTKIILDKAREKNVLIVYTQMGYKKDISEMGLLGIKIPSMGSLKFGTENSNIDPRIPPQKGDIVIQKQFSSAFFGTTLCHILTSRAIDTVIVTGVSTSACVRATVMDAQNFGYRPIVPKECVKDRAPKHHELNLVDIDAKFGDVVSIDDVICYLDNLSTQTK